MKLTKNFSLSEFRCHDGTEVPENLIPNVRSLAINLQVLRDFIKVPIYLVSAYRTEAHNNSVGGAKQSQHLVAKAGDLKAPGYTPKQLARVIEYLISEGKMKQGGIGIYETFTHYDVRGRKARW